MLGDLFAQWLIGGAQKPEGAQLLLFLGMAIFGFLLTFLLLLQNGASRLSVWPEASYYGLMWATLTAVPGLPIGAVHFVRYKGERRLSAACVVTSSAALLFAFWIFRR